MTPSNPLYFTLSDANFAPRTLAMLNSLRRFDSTSDIIFVTVGNFPENFASVFESIDVRIVNLDDLIEPSKLDYIQGSRSYLSSLWTYPSILLDQFIGEQTGYSDIVYLDADLYFYGDPNICWDEIPVGNIAIVRHNFSERLASAFPESGEFNVSWVSIPTTDIGRRCAREWADECYELCPDVPVEHLGRVVYGDQRYLDTWPDKFRGALTIFKNPGVGLAPWNFENYNIQHDEIWKVNNHKLVFFHFSSHQFGFFLARKMGRTYSQVSKVPRRLYKDYEKELTLSVELLGLSSWKSRHSSFHSRVFSYVQRKLGLEV